MSLSEDEIKDLVSKINSYVKSIKDEKLKQFVVDTLKKSGKKLKFYPAATSYHHNYIGGLIQHTYEVLVNIMMMISFMDEKEELDVDLCIAGAILHDIYKIKEYSFNESTKSIAYDNEWKKEHKSHLKAGAALANANGFPKLAHLIESHHGFINWGAEKEPQTKEAWALFLTDMISAKLRSNSL